MSCLAFVFDEKSVLLPTETTKTGFLAVMFVIFRLGMVRSCGAGVACRLSYPSGAIPGVLLKV